jgi:hypothetical protein
MSNPRGRQPIGVNQPPGGGSLYPFVAPSGDILYLLGDFFVSFDDLQDEIVYPLRVAWMYGFGSVIVSPPSGWPTPAHSHDLVVVDANDQVVFDSTVATEFTSRSWDNRLLVLEWKTEDKVCRCTKFTTWTAADIADGQTLSYDNYILPANGELQADCWYKLPKRVTSLQVGLTNIAHTRIRLDEGYNISLTPLENVNNFTLQLPNLAQTKPLAEGTRVTNRVSISAVPGNGLGTFPGCVDSELVIRTINRVRSNNYQNFNLDSSDCIRYQRPVGLLSAFPRQFDYAAFGLTHAEAASALEFNNDCKNCCDCTYFAQTYQGLKRQWFLYKDVADLAQTTRDVYSSNKDRWVAQKQIRETDMLRLRLFMDGNCKIRWGVAFCNASKCCISNVKIYLTWIEYKDGIISQPTVPQYDCPPAYINGSAQCDSEVAILPEKFGIQGNIFRYSFNYSDPQSITTISGKHCVPDCRYLPDGSVKTALYASVVWEGIADNPATGQPCVYTGIPNTSVPPEVVSVWATAGLTLPTTVYSQKLTQISIVDQVNAFCKRCECN